MDEKEIGKKLTANKEEDITEVKKEINNLIWMHGHPAITLAQAEKIACDFLQKLQGDLC